MEGAVAPSIVRAQTTLNDALSEPRPLEPYVYLPFLSASVHVLLPVPFTLVLLRTPGPLSWKFWVFETSLTTNVYLPAGSVVTRLPSSRRKMKWLPTVACSVLPPVMLVGTSCVRFGSVEMTSNSFAYFASWSSLSRSMRGLQIGSRTFCDEAGSSARISSGCACAYASDWLIAVRNALASVGLLFVQSFSAT